MKIIILFSLLMSMATTTIAQKEYATLFLRNSCFINLVDRTPKSSCLDEQLQGTNLFAVSDKDGNLLAYGNGCDFYDSNHNLIFMDKNCYGVVNSSITAIDPKDRNTIYYFYNSHANILDIGLKRKINCVVIRENDVLEFEHKTIAEDYPMGSFLCLMLHADGVRYWLLTSGQDSNTIESFLMDGGEVIQKVVNSVEYEFTRGYLYSQLLVNPEQNKIYCNYDGYIVFGFDNYTGHVTETQHIDFQKFSPFEFSPSGKYIYCQKDEDGACCIYRYLTSEFENKIFDGKKICEFAPRYHGEDVNISDMMLAYDGNIYFLLSTDKNSLLAITNPDSEEPVCIGKAIVFDNDFSNFRFFPTYVRFLPCFQINEIGCNTVNFIYRGFPTDQILWHLDDGTVLEGFNVNHTFTQSGKHSAKMIVDFSGETREIIKDFELNNVSEPPQIICD